MPGTSSGTDERVFEDGALDKPNTHDYHPDSGKILYFGGRIKWAARLLV